MPREEELRSANRCGKNYESDKSKSSPAIWWGKKSGELAISMSGIFLFL